MEASSAAQELTIRALAAASVCAACGHDAPVVAQADAAELGADAGSEAGDLLPSQLPPDFHCDSTIESITDSIFATSCKWDSCHGNNNAQWGLMLTADPATVASELVGVPSATCAPLRVAPGDPEQSFLWLKVSAKKPPCGERMPWGVVPLPEPALTCIHDWIQNL